MKNFIFAEDQFGAPYQHVQDCINRLNKTFFDVKVTKFNYDSNHPIEPGVDGVVMFTRGRVVTKEAIENVVRPCGAHDIPLYVPCIHSLFPPETYHWTMKSVKKFQPGTLSLEKLSSEDIQNVISSGLIPCMTFSM